jgi:restriction endonuclease S subunit
MAILSNHRIMDKIANLNIFFHNRSELSNRLEVEYYRPELYEIEKLVKQRTTKKLSDFIIKIASGATPSVTEEDKYYSNKENGVPFLRVQNLQVNGKLNLQDVKYINYETHNTYLKRSQVSEFDLLVKITGVGRMAIASVAPEGFVGNTNQHLVVIKTGSREISEYLARFLNLDIVEKLASRRATGATRPALDYPALKSIPIIENLDFTALIDAEVNRSIMLDKINELRIACDMYLLNELGISLTDYDNSLLNRVFISNFSDVTGGRLDPFSVTLKDKRIEGGLFENVSLGQIAKIIKGQSITKANTETGIYPVIAGGQSSPYKHNDFNHSGNVITVSASGAYAGYVWYHSAPIFASDCSVIQSKDEKKISTEFLYEILKLKQPEIYTLQQGTGQPHVYPRDLMKLKIPLPDTIWKQMEIVNTVANFRKDIFTMQERADNLVSSAKIEIEKKIME